MRTARAYEDDDLQGRKISPNKLNKEGQLLLDTVLDDDSDDPEIYGQTGGTNPLKVKAVNKPDTSNSAASVPMKILPKKKKKKAAPKKGKD